MRRFLAIAGALVAVFSTSSGNAGESTPAGAVSSPATITSCTVPGCDAAAFIAAAIDGAQREVRGQGYSFTNQTIAAALIRAKARGVDVAMLFDKTSACRRGELVDTLAAAGIAVAIDHAPRIAHNKVLIIDASLPGARVIEGSFNFTQGAMHNAENINLIGAVEIARYYRAYWDARRATSTAYTGRDVWCHTGEHDWE